MAETGYNIFGGPGYQTGEPTSAEKVQAGADIFSGLGNLYQGYLTSTSNYIPSLIKMSEEDEKLAIEDRAILGDKIEAYNRVQIGTSNLAPQTFVDTMNESSANTERDINQIKRRYQQQQNALAQANLNRIESGYSTLATGTELLISNYDKFN